MNKLQVFKNEEFGEVRSLLINNEPWFIGKQIADILGYQNGSRDIKRHVDEEDRQVIQNYQNGTLEIPNRGLMIINESGLYSLILSSKLPTAKKFKRWVTNEVLPSIRKFRRNINTKLDFNTEVEETIKYLNELSRYFAQIAFFVEAYLLLKFVWLLISILNSISLSNSIFN